MAEEIRQLRRSFEHKITPATPSYSEDSADPNATLQVEHRRQRRPAPVVLTGAAVSTAAVGGGVTIKVPDYRSRRAASGGGGQQQQNPHQQRQQHGDNVSRISAATVEYRSRSRTGGGGGGGGGVRRRVAVLPTARSRILTEGELSPVNNNYMALENERAEQIRDDYRLVKARSMMILNHAPPQQVHQQRIMRRAPSRQRLVIVPQQEQPRRQILYTTNAPPPPPQTIYSSQLRLAPTTVDRHSRTVHYARLPSTRDYSY